jgi:8-oxo-dGTP diphosphatase
MTEITGVSAALIYNESILVILRDDRPDISYRNMIDLPGGAIDPGETPLECACRETYEETGVVVADVPVEDEADYPFERRVGATRFFVYLMSGICAPQLGSEGQAVWLMPCADFLENPNVVPAQQERLRDYLSAVASRRAIA